MNSDSNSALRPLLIAEQCNPEQFSVPLVGWSHVEALFRRDDLRPHLLTQVRNREALVRAGLQEGGDFTAVDTEAIARKVYRVAGSLGGRGGKGWTTLAALKSISDAAFERRAVKAMRDRLERGDFDLVHRITPLSPTRSCGFATPLARLRRQGRNVPLILGPLNGGLPWPPGFNDARHAEREWLSYVRGASRWLPGRRSTLKNTAAFVIGSRATWAELAPAVGEARCVYLPENAVDPERFPEEQGPSLAHGKDAGLKLVFLGRLVPYKCCDLAVRASAELLRQGKATLQIIGDGPERGRIEELVRELGVADCVTFSGWVPHQHVAEELGKSDLLVFPSVREFGGGVVPEAMAAGVVPLIVDYGGPAELLSNETGWAIPTGSRDEIVASLQKILVDAEADRDDLAKRAEAGRERVRSLLTWDRKAEQMITVYRWVLGIEEKPDHASRFGVELSRYS